MGESSSSRRSAAWRLGWLAVAIVSGVVAVVVATLAVYPADRPDAQAAAVVPPAATRTPTATPGMTHPPAERISMILDRDGCDTVLSGDMWGHLLCPPMLGPTWHYASFTLVPAGCTKGVTAPGPGDTSHRSVTEMADGDNAVVEVVADLGSVDDARRSVHVARSLPRSCADTAIRVTAAEGVDVPQGVDSADGVALWLDHDGRREAVVVVRDGTRVVEVVVGSLGSAMSPDRELVTSVIAAAVAHDLSPRTPLHIPIQALTQAPSPR